MSYLMNEHMPMFIIIITISSILYTLYITREAYKLKAYRAIMTIVSVLGIPIGLMIIYVSLRLMN